MQIVTEGSAFPELQVWATNCRFKANGRQNSAKRSKRVNIGSLESEPLLRVHGCVRETEVCCFGEVFLPQASQNTPQSGCPISRVLCEKWGLPCSSVTDFAMISPYDSLTPKGLKRFYGNHDLHFITGQLLSSRA